VTIVVSPSAREDLKQAYQQIKQDNPEAADRVLARIIEVIACLPRAPLSGEKCDFEMADEFTRGRFRRTESITARAPTCWRSCACTTRRAVRLNNSKANPNANMTPPSRQETLLDTVSREEARLAGLETGIGAGQSSDRTLKSTRPI